MAPDRQINPGMRGTVTGVVHEMSDSTLDAWEAEGSFTSDSDRFVAEFAETYIEADRFQLRPGSQSQEEGGNDG